MTNYNVIDWIGSWNTKKTLNKNLKKKLNRVWPLIGNNVSILVYQLRQMYHVNNTKENCMWEVCTIVGNFSENLKLS